MVQLRWLRLRLIILSLWKFFYGSGVDPQPREASQHRFRLTLKYLSGSSCGSGQNCQTRVVPRIAGEEVLDSRDDAEWPRGSLVAKRSISGEEGAEQPEERVRS